MANFIYKKAKERFLKGDIDLINETVKVALVSAAYTPSQTHEALSDIPSGARVAISGALTNKSVTDGVFDADDVVIQNVSGSQIKALVIFIDSGTESTSYLVAYLDTGYNLPMTPDGGNINIIWSDEDGKIFG